MIHLIGLCIGVLISRWYGMYRCTNIWYRQTNMYYPYRSSIGPICTAHTERYTVVTGTWTARYQAVPSKIDRRRSIEREIDSRRSIEKEKGKKKRKRKKKEGKKEYLAPASSSLACHRLRAVAARGWGRKNTSRPRRPHSPVVAARGRGRNRFFSLARRRSVSPRRERSRRHRPLFFF
ncbi:hypothetical protein BHE74_00058103 [Ensete ventricosum]|nr:hypothetical protein BHE74_00058103 [Ensete ventricosum]